MFNEDIIFSEVHILIAISQIKKKPSIFLFHSWNYVFLTNSDLCDIIISQKSINKIYNLDN